MSEAELSMIQQAAEMVMGDVGLIPLHYEVSTWRRPRASSTLHAPINTRLRLD